MILNALIIVVTLILFGFLAFSRRLGKSTSWKAILSRASLPVETSAR